MPCGGIYPVDGDSGVYAPGYDPQCFYCGQAKNGPWSFVEEWDALIHDLCIDDFLKTREGLIVVAHGHEIMYRPRFDFPI